MSAPPRPQPAEPSDAQLVAGVLAGDRDAFATVYDRYGDRLHDFCHALLRHREEAADAVADTFVLFAERVGQLRDPNRLRPWLYAIARSEGLRRLKARRRFVPDAETELIAMPDHATAGPERAAEQAALRDLVWNAAAGLADRDRALLDLHLRQGLDGAELGEAMGVSTQHAYVLLSRLRTQVERSLGALLIARLGRRDCSTLNGLLTDWDGRFSPLVRKRVARHVDSCDVCTQRRRLVASPWALLSTVALVPAPLALRDRVVQQTRLVAARTPTPGPAGTGGATGLTRTRIQAGAAVLTVLALGTIALLWPSGPDGNRTADAVSVPAPAGPVAPPATGSSGPVGPPAVVEPPAPGSA
ncbi:MAG: RNA polymerase sigma factor, partial [Pseudonocardiaceae bacterium]